MNSSRIDPFKHDQWWDANNLTHWPIPFCNGINFLFAIQTWNLPPPWTVLGMTLIPERMGNPVAAPRPSPDVWARGSSPGAQEGAVSRSITSPHWPCSSDAFLFHETVHHMLGDPCCSRVLLDYLLLLVTVQELMFTETFYMPGTVLDTERAWSDLLLPQFRQIGMVCGWGREACLRFLDNLLSVWPSHIQTLSDRHKRPCFQPVFCTAFHTGRFQTLSVTVSFLWSLSCC